MTTILQTPQVSPPSAQNADLFDYALLRDYAGFIWRAPRRHKLLAATCFFAVVSLAVLALQVLPKRWRVAATLLAQRNPIMSMLSNPGLNRDADSPTRGARELVLRRENLVSLLKQTGFVERHLEGRSPAARARAWIFEKLGKQRSAQQLFEELVDAVESRLWVQVSADAGTMEIGFEWSDRDLTYDLVEAALQNFLEARQASETSSVSETIAILESHAAKARNQIVLMLDELEQKERQPRKGQPPRRQTATSLRVPNVEDVAMLQARLASRRRALTDLEEFRQRRLEELQGQLVQQLTIFAEQHPIVAGTRKNVEALNRPSPQIERLRAEITNLEREIIRQGGRPGEAAVAQPELTRDEFSDVRLRLDSDDPRLEYERNQLRLLFRQYATLTDRIDAAQVEMNTAQAAFKYRYSVITPPLMPRNPVRPNGFLILAASFVGAVFFAFFACAAVDLRSGVIIERWQIARQLDLPVLAEVGR